MQKIEKMAIDILDPVLKTTLGEYFRTILSHCFGQSNNPNIVSTSIFNEG